MGLRLSRIPVVEKRMSICGSLFRRSNVEAGGITEFGDGDDGPAEVWGLLMDPTRL